MAIHRSAPLSQRDERELFAEYPFLPGAESLVAEFSPSVRELLFDPALERARDLGRARVRAAADDPTGATGLEELAHATREERFLSFLFARLLVSSGSTAAPMRRWAVAEAKRSFGRLAATPTEELVEVARRLGFSYEPTNGAIALALTDYLRLGVSIREAEFRLARQGVRAGKVLVGRERAARLLQEGIRMRLAVPAVLAEDIRSTIEQREHEFLADIRRRIPLPVARASPGITSVKPDRFPPCIRKMRRMLEEGENLSHSGRFALAAFLHQVGADFETIVDAYRGAPDFDEAVTRYQVEHITQRDDGRGYSPPECETLRSHGLCFREGDPTAKSETDRGRDRLCFESFLRHPLQYYEIRGGGVMRRKAEEPTGGVAAGEAASGRPTGRERGPSIGRR